MAEVKTTYTIAAAGAQPEKAELLISNYECIESQGERIRRRGSLV